MQAASAVVTVEPMPPVALALALAMMNKLSHDLNNAQLSSQSLLELAMLDHPELAPLLDPVHKHLRRPRQVLETSLRALPTRASVRPRVLSAWPARVAAEAAALQVELRLPAILAGPAGLPEDDWTQCLDNLVHNAMDSHELGRRLHHDYAQPPWISVEQNGPSEWHVMDNGPGCQDLQLAARGSPRQGAGHLGLGLAVVAAHLARIGGTLTVAQRGGTGITAVMQWPLI